MRMIPAGLHRSLDFLTVAAFALAPSLFGLTGLPAVLAYALAAVHLAMTLITRFPPKMAGPVPLRLHGAVECAVGITLLALPWLAGWSGTPRAFFLAAGAVILSVWALSHYGMAASRAAA